MPGKNWEVDKKKAEEFVKGVNKGGPSFSEAVENLKRSLGAVSDLQKDTTSEDEAKRILSEKRKKASDMVAGKKGY
ncbi:hypothetical protein E6Q11_02500 [Candidatus Dojkabacteria bacterium]|uniref:Uncharacterized protein n=1 Tax=Candidatus Dojkabacteria bacterium TaxID=2099670 RepID=A0A5C7J7Y7_9BACT|nr:MAG: hypothetical protein E6Q11_02500 [Candidatus Dojkabacteria bacterium]